MSHQSWNQLAIKNTEVEWAPNSQCRTKVQVPKVMSCARWKSPQTHSDLFNSCFTNSSNKLTSQVFFFSVWLLLSLLHFLIQGILEGANKLEERFQTARDGLKITKAIALTPRSKTHTCSCESAHHFWSFSTSRMRLPCISASSFRCTYTQQTDAPSLSTTLAEKNMTVN